MSSESDSGVFSGESYVGRNDYSSPPPSVIHASATGEINIKNYLKNLEDRLFSSSANNPNYRWAFRSLVVLSADQFKSLSMRPVMIVLALKHACASYIGSAAIFNLLRANGIPEEAISKEFIAKAKEEIFAMLVAEQTRLTHESSLANAKFW